jgi:hypothetical protein
MCHEKLNPTRVYAMSLQAIEAEPKHRHPAFPTDLRRSEVSAASSVVRRGISSQRKQASIAPVYRRPSSKTFEGLRQSTRIFASAFAAAVAVSGVCILWVVVGWNELSRESNSRAAALVAPIDSRGKSNILADRAALVPRAEFDALRSTAEAAKIKQQQALDQERARADTLARELTSLKAELEALRTIDSEEAVQAAAGLIEKMRALDQERARADALARELETVRNALDAGNRQIASLNAPAANAPPALYLRKPAVDSSQERTTELASAELPSATIGEKRRAPTRTSSDAIAFSPEHSTTPELPLPSALTARKAAPYLSPKVAIGTSRATSASAAFRSHQNRLRMHRSRKPTLAAFARCLNVPARDLPSCLSRPRTRTYRSRDVRRLAASTTRRSGSKHRNGNQLVENDSSKGATQ